MPIEWPVNFGVRMTRRGGVVPPQRESLSIHAFEPGVALVGSLQLERRSSRINLWRSAQRGELFSMHTQSIFPRPPKPSGGELPLGRSPR